MITPTTSALPLDENHKPESVLSLAGAKVETKYAGNGMIKAPKSALAEKFELRYEPTLDGLRAVSVLCVLAFHAGFWGRGGFLGVDVFFVLSGFLITALLIKEHSQSGRIDFGAFYVRRALRLFPALLTVMAALIVAAVMRPPTGGVWVAVKSILPAFYVSDYVAVHEALGHTWSLSVEEQFYVIWPLLLSLLLLVKLPPRWMLGVLAFLVAVVAIHRSILWKAVHVPGELFNGRLYATFDTRADSLLVGCMVGLLLSYNLISLRPVVLKLLRAFAVVSVLVFSFLVLTVKLPSPFLYLGGFTAIAAMTGIFIVGLLTSPIPLLAAFFELRPLVWIGRLSYGIYLWHVPVFLILKNYVPPLAIRSYTLRSGITFGLEILATILVAAISFYLIELPCLRLKSRLRSRKSKTPVEAVMAVSSAN
jgi:peptidoglycan/LPS O-acetylase OafA/YrhL